MKNHKTDAFNDALIINEAKNLINLHKCFDVKNDIFGDVTSKVQHILLIYENMNDLETYIQQYVNEGLKRKELCVHATVNLMGENYIKNFATGIHDYHKNRKERNLTILNLEPYYKKVIEGNLKLFDKFAKQMLTRTGTDGNDGSYKKVRVTIDCASHLFENGYFDQSVELETWWHQKPFAGSYLCPYPKSMLDKFPNSIYFSTLFHIHDIVIDTTGRKVTEDMIFERQKGIK